MPTQLRNSDLPELLGNDSFKFGLWTEVMAAYQCIPGLTGFWPISSIQRSTGNVYDLSGQGRTLTYTGGAGSYYSYSYLYPFFHFAGGGLLSRADETDLDIIGTSAGEPSNVNRGFTIGGWFRIVETPSTTYAVFAKGNPATGSNYSYGIWIWNGSASTIRGFASSNGTSYADTGGVSYSLNIWHFIVVRYVASTSVQIIIDMSTSSTQTSSVPASLYNSTSSLLVWSQSGGSNTQADCSMLFLSHAYVSDSILNGIYQRSRYIFGV